MPIFYNDFTAVSGIEGVSKEAAKSAAKSNQNPVQRVMTTLAEIFTPIIVSRKPLAVLVVPKSF